MNQGQKNSRRLAYLLLSAYLLLVLYGSWFPWNDWHRPAEQTFHFATFWPAHVSRADLLANLLIYIPLGALLTWSLRRRTHFKAAILGLLFGAAVSFTVETVQVFIPPRQASLSDVAMNSLGSLLGSLMASAIHVPGAPRTYLRVLREKWIEPGSSSMTALAAVLVWVCSQLTPFVPSLDVGSVRHALSGAYHTLRDPSRFDVYSFAMYAFAMAGLMLLLTMAFRRYTPAIEATLLIFAATVAIKPFIVTRQLSLEVACAYVVAAILFLIMRALPGRHLTAATFAIMSFATYEIAPASGTLQKFGWVPFANSFNGVLNGVTFVLEISWPFLTLAACAQFWAENRKQRQVIFWAGSLFVIALTFALEWHQRMIPGRYGDISVTIVATTAWLIPWGWYQLGNTELEVTTR